MGECCFGVRRSSARGTHLVLCGRQLREQGQTAKAQFYLMLDEAFRDHNATYCKFARSDCHGSDTVGIWHGPEAMGPNTAEEWMDTRMYLEA